ncbi:MAG: methyltransferase domain-containing protein [Pedosphaera sp.]|nr:methyltransferase domain-containing protein [Pedosphaera sp.]
MASTFQVESAVRRRYSEAAGKQVAALCCPIEYDRQYLKVIPQEIIDRDYGCGDPSKHLRTGETVLDLGSGTGKIAFIAAQVVGPTGRIIGVDMNDDMLQMARKYAPVVGQAIGFHNVEFRKGRIQDLALDLERLDADLKSNPIQDANSFLAAGARAEELRLTAPLIAENSVDVVISNCVLNLVEPQAKQQLFREIFRVLRQGGRAVISDIVSDERVPMEMQNDPVLWSGCIAGALTEAMFIQAFADAGFYGARILQRDAQPWQTVSGIEFRALTIEAFKGRQADCFDHNQAVIYKGPFKEVVDDDGHHLERGLRYAVCDKTYQLYRKAPYHEYFEFVDPRVPIAPADAKPFTGVPGRLRDPRETKGVDYRATTSASQCCDAGSCC